jgi:hypothetical protein
MSRSPTASTPRPYAGFGRGPVQDLPGDLRSVALCSLITGSGNEGYPANVRFVIKRIRNRFRAIDPAFDEIESDTSFGYCWRKSD